MIRPGSGLKKISFKFLLLMSIGLLTISFWLNVSIGAVDVPFGSMLKMILKSIPGLVITPDWSNSLETIIMQIRLPHAVLIILTGASLAGSGAVYQGLFRNPLADPYLIGVASGAGLGAVTAMTLFNITTSLGLFLVPLSAFLGGFITISLVIVLARVSGVVKTTSIILAGVAVGSFASAITSFLMLRSQGELTRALSWLLGGILMSGWTPVLVILPYIILGLTILATSGYSLNVLQFGDSQARQVGLRVERAKMLILISASITTAAAVSFAGVIGFVGLIVPHIVRLLIGSDYRRLIIISIISGGVLLLMADVLARSLMSPQTIPVGIITALLGAPFFIWVLRRSRRKGW